MYTPGHRRSRDLNNPEVRMPRISDTVIKSFDFKRRLAQADGWAEANDMDRWAARVVWVALIYGVLGAKRFCQRRANYKTSRAWTCYLNLVKAGLFSEDPEGIVWNEGTEPWHSDPMLWMAVMVDIAGGGEPPPEFPRNIEEDA